MPVVKHRANFSELVVKAADHVIKKKTRAAKYATAVEAQAKRRASSRGGSELQRARSSMLRSHSRVVSTILVVSSMGRQLLANNIVNVLRVAFIVAAFVALSSQTSQSTVHRFGGTLNVANIAIDIYFLLEGILKVFVLYSTVVIQNDIGLKQNYGDLFVESGFVEITVACISLTAGESKLSLWLRLVRLLFISTTGLKYIPQIDVLLSGIGLGLVSLMSTWLLLSVVFFLYAACALTLFARNDPFHFGSIAMSMWTFFEMATLDDELNGTAFLNTNTVSVEKYGEMFLPICSTPQPRPMLSALVFITFILLCGFILVSLTVAAVTSGINNRINAIEMHDDAVEEIDIEGILGNEESNEKFEDKFDPALVLLMLKQVWKQAEDYARKIESKKKKRNATIHPTTANTEGIEALRKKFNNGNGSTSFGMSWKNVSGAFSMQKQSISMRNAIGRTRYKVFFAFTVLMAATMEIWVLQERTRPTSVEVFQALLQFYFSLDVYIRIVAHFPDYVVYFVDKWNQFDTTVVILTWIPSFTALLHAKYGSYFGLLRVLHILRVLRLLTWISNLNIMMKAISGSVRALVYVVLLMCLFFFHFAIAGVFLFANNDPYHFENLLKSFVTLFQICTLDNWADIARTNMYGCDLYGYDTGKTEYDSLCTEPLALGWFAAWYFVIFIVLGVMVLISLFVGIIITSMELLKEGQVDETEMWTRIREVQERYKIHDSGVDNMLEIFEIIDRTKNARLTFAEIQPLLELVLQKEVDRVQLFMKIDDDKSGQIDFSEFLQVVMELLPHYSLHQVETERRVAAYATTKKSDRIKRRRQSLTNLGSHGLPSTLANFQAAHNIPRHSGSIDSQSEESLPILSSQLPADARSFNGDGSSPYSNNPSGSSGVIAVKEEQPDDNVTSDSCSNAERNGPVLTAGDEYSCESTYAREDGVPGVDYLWLK